MWIESRPRSKCHHFDKNGNQVQQPSDFNHLPCFEQGRENIRAVCIAPMASSGRLFVGQIPKQNLNFIHVNSK